MENKLSDFIKMFGIEGCNERFKGCTSKNGDVCNGEYKVEDDQLFFTYTDSKNRIYDSLEMPSRVIETGLIYHKTNYKNDTTRKSGKIM